MKEVVVDVLSKELKVSKKEVENLVEVPPADKLGDYSFPCFGLAKEKKKNPMEIASDLCEKLRTGLPKEISNVDFKGAYINFFLDKKVLAKSVLRESSKKGFGSHNIEKKKVGMEYPAPNTNKNLHLGHLRNIAIGESVTAIVKNAGNKTFHLNLFNDRGILISKAMIGYEKFSKGKTPESEKIKPDKFVGDLYVSFSKESKDDPALEEEAKEKLRLWETGDKETLKLWKKLNNWTYKGMQETFDTFGLSKIDKNYYESDLYGGGEKMIYDGLKKGIFKKREDGAVIINLEKEKLGEKVLLRSDGTSVYITQDIYLADKKIKDFKLDSSYHVVGNDQDYHFKVLFLILDRLGMKKDWKHLSYGMIRLPTGKMKGREGQTISADDMIAQTKELAKKGILFRSPDMKGKKELEKNSLIISLAAIKYALLKVDVKKGIVFDPKEALSFEGDTGPYLLYSYARANSILKKVKKKREILPKSVIPEDLKDSEIRLLKKIGQFPDISLDAYKSLSPHVVANYSFELAKTFNEFYHAESVLGSSEEGFRLELVSRFKDTLEKALGLLGIETLDRM
jgi:arginyl-tRNA synthetase